MAFVLKISSAKMPNSCYGIYKRIGLLEVEDGTIPTMISVQAKAVKRIVKTWERLHCGKTEKSEFYRVLKEAQALCEELNDGRPLWALAAPG